MKIKVRAVEALETFNSIQRLDLFKLSTMMVATRLHERVSPYAPSSAANRPQRGKMHYERGRGSVYTRVDGGRTVEKTSETANRRWVIKEGRNMALLSNSASYAGLLWDADYQPPYHGQRGWRTWQEEFSRMSSSGELAEFIDEILRSIK